MTSIISPDDFEAGIHITALHESIHGSTELCSLKGTCLQIIAVALPYVVVEANDTARGKAILTIDVRNYQFIRLGQHYVDTVSKHCTDETPG